MIRMNMFICVLFLYSCISYSDSVSKLEMPVTTSNDYVINYTGYSVCYDVTNKIPRWVAYELLDTETDGPYTRKGKTFRRDEKQSVEQANDSDYKGGVWSKGHMAPAGDFKWSDDAMWDTFFYTNCVPQNTKLNNGSWNTLENKVRSYAKKYGKVYVVTGPIIGQNVNGIIGENGITVPDLFFKALLICNENNYSTAGFVMKNTDEKQQPLESIVSIDELEVITGLDFFPLLDDDIEKKIESVVNIEYWH